MKLERFKSILLVLLVISSIVLTVNKWFDEKLWPGGYNFFSDVKNHFSSGSSQTSVAFDPIEEILKPAKIILNNSGEHILYTKSSSEYASLFSQIKSALEHTSKSGAPVQVDASEWNDALKRNSCYFSYPVRYDASFFFYQLSDKTHTGDITNLKEFIFVQDNRISQTSHIYVKDEKSSNIYKYAIDFQSDILTDMINEVSLISTGTNYYSFELNFDKEDENAVTQHVIIDPDVLLNITPMQTPSIYEHNGFSDISLEEDIYNEILRVFGYNTSTIRRYTEHDNSLVFVENYGTLKLHTNGFLDYRSVNQSQGVVLQGDTTYECINSCMSFVNSVTTTLGLSDAMYYELSTDIENIKSKSFVLNFDYYINDRMIIPDNSEHAITVEVNQGKIVAYKQLCKSFYNTDTLETCPSSIDAIDMIEADSYLTSDAVSDLFMAYSFDATGYVWRPLWYIENKSGDILTVSSKPEVIQ